jgi:HEAT repeat protein
MPAVLLLGCYLLLGSVRPALAAPGDTAVDADTKKTLADLRSPNPEKRKSAAEQLAKATPDDATRVKVAAALEVAMADPSIAVRGPVTKALIVWGGKENVRGLIRLVGHNDIFVRHGAMEVLGQLQDDRATKPVAARLAVGVDRGAAGQSLRKMGVSAEKAVIPYTGNPDPRTREEACMVLKEIGGKASVYALKIASKDPDPKVVAAAKDALDSAKTR